MSGGAGGNNFPTTSNAYASCNANGFFTKLAPAGDTLVYSTCLPGTSSFSAVAIDSAGLAYVTGATGGSLPTTPSAFQSQFTGCGGYANAFFSVLDPSASGSASLIYSTYLGATGVDCSLVTWGDSGQAITVDAYGMAYVTGWTSGPTFPVTAGAYLTTFPATHCFGGCLRQGNLPSAFVAKFNRRGFGAASLIYSTFLGASWGTAAYGIAVDPQGSAYVTGLTGGYFGGLDIQKPFPTTLGAFQSVFDGQDGFVTKFNAAGNGLIYSTLLGGSLVQSNAQGSTAVALDAFNEAYVTGYTTALNFPTTPSAFQPNDPNPNVAQAFVTQFNTAGTALVYSSFLGGTRNESGGNGIALDQVGDAYVTGNTLAIDFPLTPLAFQPLYGGQGDAFVTKFPTSGAISVTAILSNFGGNAGRVTPQIFGTGFHNGASAKLACGQINVPGNNVSVSAGGQILTATFDLTTTVPGTCDVVVTNPDMTSAQLSQGFTVQQGGAADVRVSKTATGIVPGRNAVYSIAATNAGNVDSPNFVASEFIEPWFTYQSASPSPTEILTAPVEWPPSKVGDGESYDDLINWNVPTLPAQSTQPFSYVVQLDQLFPIAMNVTGQACRASPNDVRNCNALFGGCLVAVYALCAPEILGGPAAYAACIIANAAACYIGRYTCMLIAGAGPLGSFGACSSVVKPAQHGVDPNQLIGPHGVELPMWVAGVQPLNYILEFENDGTSAVQRVVTTNPLNTAALDPTTLRLATMTVASYQVPIPPGFAPQVGMDQFDTNLDLRPAQNLFVQIHVSLDPATGLITWVFQSIDPTTGLPPIDPTIGFLAPGASTTLFFTVNPKRSLATGAQITDQATITFDVNQPMNTQPWTNTLDNTPPVSRVAALPGTELCSNFNVQWSGNDVGSGVGNYTIYVSDDGGSFTAWQTNTTSTSAVYNGQVGHSYGFYSIAQDLVGNVEAGKSSAEATTQVNKGTICGPVGPPTPLGGR